MNVGITDAQISSDLSIRQPWLDNLFDRGELELASECASVVHTVKFSGASSLTSSDSPSTDRGEFQ